MEKNYKLILGLGLCMLMFSHSLNAQILQTRSEIMESYGTPFCSGIANNGDSYMYYKFPITTKSSGTYNQRRVIFLKKGDDGVETCYKMKILEPASETAQNIFSFTRDLVNTGENQWTDHAKGIIYKVEEKRGVCSITAWYDNQAGLAKVYKF